MTPQVLDASALLALLNAEPGADTVVAALPTAVISTVNLSEVIAKLRERNVSLADVNEALDGLSLDVRSFDFAQGRIAGDLRPVTRELGLSFGDRACLALGQVLGLPVLTADAAMLRFGGDVNLVAVR